MIKTSEIKDGQVFSIDGGQTWQMAAVNMSSMGVISCYVSGRKSSNGNCVRVDVSAHETALVVGTVLVDGEGGRWEVTSQGLHDLVGDCDWDWQALEDNGGLGLLVVLGAGDSDV